MCHECNGALGLREREETEEWVGSPISQCHSLQGGHQSDNNSPPPHPSVAFSKLNTAGCHTELGKLNKTLNKERQQCGDKDKQPHLEVSSLKTSLLRYWEGNVSFSLGLFFSKDSHRKFNL